MMKPATTVLAMILLAGAMAGPAMARDKELPKVDEQKVEMLYKDYLGTGMMDTEFDKPDDVKRKIREDLGRLSVIEDEIKRIRETTTDPKKKIRLEIADAQNATDLLRLYLMATADVSDKEIRETYTTMVNVFKVQLAAFDTEAEAKENIEALKKGLVMTDLIASLAAKGINTDINQTEPHYVSFTEMDFPVGEVVVGLSKGQIAPEPVFSGGKWIIVKLQDVKPSGEDTPPLNEVEGQVRQIVSVKKASERLAEIMRPYEDENEGASQEEPGSAPPSAEPKGSESRDSDAREPEAASEPVNKDVPAEEAAPASQDTPSQDASSQDAPSQDAAPAAQ